MYILYICMYTYIYMWVWVRIKCPKNWIVHTKHKLKPVVLWVLNLDP